MNLLFVCSGNSCRSPMAMAIAKHCFGDQVECNSAAGNLVNGRFIAGQNVSQNAVKALKELYKIDIINYKPKPLSEELVKKADWALFLGERFWRNGKEMFPRFESSMTYYGSYKNLLAPRSEMIDIPDPFDGQSWGNFYPAALPWPGKVLDSYKMVAEAMMKDFQKQLAERLKLSFK